MIIIRKNLKMLRVGLCGLMAKVVDCGLELSKIELPSHYCIHLLLYCHLLIHAKIYIYMLDTYRRNEQQTQ